MLRIFHNTTPKMAAPIGVFDSGYGGLTILREIVNRLPEYDYLYLGDNARAPYGERSFEIVFEFTRQAVLELFRRGCQLVILACNTASAKALRTIQQTVLPILYPNRRVLGVIRPTVETLGSLTHTRHVGVLATPGTVASESYTLEIHKTDPDIIVTEKACPIWVHLVENNEVNTAGAEYFVKTYLSDIMRHDPEIDTLILGCTHYPLLLPQIEKFVPENVNVIAQGGIVAESLADYLRRHPEMERTCSRGGVIEYMTTESEERFDTMASQFMGRQVHSHRINLE